jgi:hypothetical protein
MVTGIPHLALYDGSGAVQLDVPLTPSTLGVTKFAVAGTRAVVLHAGPNGSNQGAVTVYSLLDGSLLSAIYLPFNPGTGIAVSPEHGLAFTVCATCPMSIVPIDIVNGFAHAPIGVGWSASVSNGIGPLTVHQGRVYTLCYGTGLVGQSTPYQLAGVDIASLSPLTPAPVPWLYAGGPQQIAFGTDAQGPAIYANNQGTLLRIDPVTLTPIPIGVVSLTTATQQSAGGTELLQISTPGIPPSVERFEMSAGTISTISSFPTGSLNFVAFGVLPSDTLRKAYLLTSAQPAGSQGVSSQLVSFSTDTPTSTFTVASLQAPFPLMKMVID